MIIEIQKNQLEISIWEKLVLIKLEGAALIPIEIVQWKELIHNHVLNENKLTNTSYLGFLDF